MFIPPPAKPGNSISWSIKYRRVGEGREAAKGHRLLLPRWEWDGHRSGLHLTLCHGRCLCFWLCTRSPNAGNLSHSQLKFWSFIIIFFLKRVSKIKLNWLFHFLKSRKNWFMQKRHEPRAGAARSDVLDSPTTEMRFFFYYFLQIILEAILPHYLQQIQKPSYEKDGKTEREIIQQLSSAIRTLVHNCEALAK